MSVKLEESWLKLLADQFEQPYFKQIKEKLLQEKAEHHVVYPPGSKIFAVASEQKFLVGDGILTKAW